MFGTLEAAGAYGDGIIYELPAGSYSTPKVLINFSSTGFNPYGGLIIDSQGDLFGTTESGSTGYADGAVYELPNTGTVKAPVYATAVTNLVTFTGTGGPNLGANPYFENLMFDSKGDILGPLVMAGPAMTGRSSNW